MKVRLRDEMERRFSHLSNFFGCYLHQDWPEMHGTPEKAIDHAIIEHPLELRQQVRLELANLLDATNDNVDLRNKLNDGLGVNVHFRKSAEARAFAEMTQAKLMTSIKQHFESNREGYSP